jgi:hypothetical protein
MALLDQITIETADAFQDACTYGGCKTDLPSKQTGEGYIKYIRRDYIHGDKHQLIAKKLFARLGLPLPSKEQIYRGQHEDLLFLDQYGLTMRIGEIDVADFINPAILQPLSWITIEGLTCAIYPGIRHQDFNPSEHIDYEEFCSDSSQYSSTVTSFLTSSFQKANDTINVNVGLVRSTLGNLKGDIPLLFDVNSDNNHTIDDDFKAIKDIINTINIEDRPQGMIDIMAILYSDIDHFAAFMAAQHVHHPLRQELSNALAQDNTALRQEKMAHFFAHCEQLTRCPEGDLALYSPWTGAKQNNKLLRLIAA